MTRSSARAWKGWAPARALVHRAGEQTRLGSQRQGDDELRFSAIGSASRPTRAIGAAVLALAFAPSTALAGLTAGPRSHPETTITQQTTNPEGASAVLHPPRVDPPPSCGLSGHQILSLGSGFANQPGSCSVRALQRRLAGAGYAPGPIDGLYGPLTGGAVLRFQEAHGLLVDGIAGPATLSSLTAQDAPLYPGAGYLSGGSRPVRALQRRLADSGFSPGPADGLYGPRTEGAVRRFQAARRLPVTGIAGRQTIASLWKEAVRPRPINGREPSRPIPGSRNPSGPAGGSRKPMRPSSDAGKHPQPAALSGKPAPASKVRKPSSPPISVWIVFALLLAALAALFAVGRRRQRHETGGLRVLRDGRGRVVWYVESPTSEATASEPVRGTAAVESIAPAGPESDQPTPDSHAEPNGGPGEQDAAVAAFTLGGTLADRGDFAGAETAYRRAAANGHADAASNLGVLLEQRGDLSGAEASYRQADELGRAVGALNLGGLLAERGDFDDAEAAYSRAADRGDPEGAFNLAGLLADRGDLAGAEAIYRRADADGHPEAALNLGELLERRGDLADAEAVYRRAAERGHTDAAFNLGGLLSEQGDVAGAEAAYRLADEQGHADAASNLGVLLEQHGDMEGAEAAYRRADKRGHAVAAFNLGCLLEDQGDLRGAEAAYRRADEGGREELAAMAREALKDLRRAS